MHSVTQGGTGAELVGWNQSPETCPEDQTPRHMPPCWLLLSAPQDVLLLLPEALVSCELILGVGLGLRGS